MTFLCHEDGLPLAQRSVEAEGPLPAAEAYAGQARNLRVVVEPGCDESRACFNWGDDCCLRYEVVDGQLSYVVRFGM